MGVGLWFGSSFLSALQVFCHFFVAYMVSDEKFAVIQVIFPCRKGVSFSLATCKIFSLSLVFRSLITICLGMDFFGFVLLGFAEVLKFVGLCPMPNLGSFDSLSL